MASFENVMSMFVIPPCSLSVPMRPDRVARLILDFAPRRAALDMPSCLPSLFAISSFHTPGIYSSQLPRFELLRMCGTEGASRLPAFMSLGAHHLLTQQTFVGYLQCTYSWTGCKYPKFWKGYDYDTSFKIKLVPISSTAKSILTGPNLSSDISYEL